jgi:chitinase
MNNFFVATFPHQRRAWNSMTSALTWGMLGMIAIPSLFGQDAETKLVGYWHNWNDANAPFLALDAVDDRYDWVEIAFALPASLTDMTLVFNPEGISQADFTDQIQTLQAAGKKVLLSIGGATANFDLATEENQLNFINSANALIDLYGFDGIDVDIEHGSCILVTGGTVAAPSNESQVRLIEAIQQIMANHRATHGEKLLLTFAPETAYVQGGQSAFGSIWGGYLPLLDALRDSLDAVQVQLYNSGSMLGLDGIAYEQGTADFIVSLTEAVIQGFNTAGGTFEGLPANKVLVGLPACSSAAGGGYTDPATVAAAVNYLKGVGPQPGSYALVNPSGYPDLGGMMTWSINWDAAESCGTSYAFAELHESLFPAVSGLLPQSEELALRLYPNPSSGSFFVETPAERTALTLRNALGQALESRQVEGGQLVEFQVDSPGMFWVQISTDAGTTTLPLIVQR